MEDTEQEIHYSCGYSAGYEEACNVLKGQMLDKMEYYRSILSDALPYLDGDRGILGREVVIRRINQELRLNPRFEILEYMPHAKFLHGPGWDSAINTGPEPK